MHRLLEISGQKIHSLRRSIAPGAKTALHTTNYAAEKRNVLPSGFFIPIGLSIFIYCHVYFQLQHSNEMK